METEASRRCSIKNAKNNESRQDERIDQAFRLLAEVAAERRGETHNGPTDKLTKWEVKADYKAFRVIATVIYDG